LPSAKYNVPKLEPGNEERVAGEAWERGEATGFLEVLVFWLFFFFFFDEGSVRAASIN
jgi:hypothetical protein